MGPLRLSEEDLVNSQANMGWALVALGVVIAIVGLI
jgi:type II secretory pathway pseudopilin PulG